MVHRNNNVENLIYFFLSTNKKFMITSSTPLIKNSYIFHFFQLHKKNSSTKILVNILAPNNSPIKFSGKCSSSIKCSSSNNKNENVLLRNYRIMLNYKISLYLIEFYQNILDFSLHVKSIFFWIYLFFNMFSLFIDFFCFYNHL